MTITFGTTAPPSSTVPDCLHVAAAGGHHVAVPPPLAGRAAEVIEYLSGHHGIVKVPGGATLMDVLGTVSRPGLASRADRRVLLAAIGPKVPREVIDGLIVTMDAGLVTICARGRVVERPSRPQVVLAAGRDQLSRHRRLYSRVLVADRVCEQLGADLIAQVGRARQAAAQRWEFGRWHRNQEVPAEVLLAPGAMTAGCERLLDESVRGGRLAPSWVLQVMRVAWTVADLAGRDSPAPADVQWVLDRLS